MDLKPKEQNFNEPLTMEYDSGSDMELDSDYERSVAIRLKSGVGLAPPSAGTNALTGSGAGRSGSKTRQMNLMAETPGSSSGPSLGNVSDGAKRGRQEKGVALGRVSAPKPRQERVTNGGSKTKAVVKKGETKAKTDAGLPRTKRVSGKKDQPPTPGQPQWRIVRPCELMLEPGKSATHITTSDSNSILKPRIWISSKKELISIMPELSGSKCINAISWGLTETPVVVLDDDNVIGVDVDDENDVVNAVMIRDFTCMSCDIDRDLDASFQPQKSLFSDSHSITESSSVHPGSPHMTPLSNQAFHDQYANTKTQPSNATPTKKRRLRTQLPTPPSSQSHKLSSATWVVDTSTEVRETHGSWVFPPSPTKSFDAKPVPPQVILRDRLTLRPPRWACASTTSTLPQQHVSNTPPSPPYNSPDDNYSPPHRPLPPPRLNAPSIPASCQRLPSSLPNPFIAQTRLNPFSDPSHVSNMNPRAVLNPPTSINPILSYWETHSSSNYSTAVPFSAKSTLQQRSPPPSPYCVAPSLHFSYDMPPRPIQSSTCDRPLHGSPPSATHPKYPVSSSFTAPASQLPTPPHSSSRTSHNIPRASTPSPSPRQNIHRTTTSFPVTHMMDIDRQTDFPPTPLYPVSNVGQDPDQDMGNTFQGPPSGRGNNLFSRLSPAQDILQHNESCSKAIIGHWDAELARMGTALDALSNGPGSRFGVKGVKEQTDQTDQIVAPLKRDSPHLLPESNVEMCMGPIDQRIPVHIPPEIQILIDAYIQNTPIVVIASHASITKNWGWKLPEEFAYMYMGFFRVIGVQETPLPPPTRTKRNLDRNHVVGRVSWCFKFKWATGGEQFLPPHRHHSISRPWWIPKPTSTKTPKRRRPDDGDDSDLESTPRYRRQRRESDHYPYRNLDLNHRYYSILPPHLLGPRDQFSDKVFPRGWYCETCGKVNEQVMLRHRTCSSSYCQDNQSIEAYALELECVRDPQQTLPLILPLDVYPDTVEPSATLWQDGIRTFSYDLKKDGAAVVKHIFTCNLVGLQEEPTSLFRDFQMNVRLRQQDGDGAGYFSYLVGVGHDGSCTTPVSWKDAPGCVSQARDFLVHRGRWYGEQKDENFTINKLIARSWVTSGSRRGTNVFEAKKHDVLVLCLGQDVALTIVPRSGLVKPEEGPGHIGMNDLDSLHHFEEDDLMDSCAYLKEDQDHNDHPSEMEPMIPGAIAKSPPPITRSTKCKSVTNKSPKSGLLLALVHGDIVLLSGDDFDYSIKRMGTTILLIGSYVQEP